MKQKTQEDKLKLNMMRKLTQEEMDLIDNDIRFWRMSFCIGSIIFFVLGILGGALVIAKL